MKEKKQTKEKKGKANPASSPSPAHFFPLAQQNGSSAPAQASPRLSLLFFSLSLINRARASVSPPSFLLLPRVAKPETITMATESRSS